MPQVDPKFKALVHFIISQCPDPSFLGAVKLNKTLWYADVLSYKHYGSSISGTEYIKKQRGPVARFMPKCVEELASEKAIFVREPRYEFDVRCFTSLEDPDVTSLSEQERSLAIHVLNTLLGKTAAEISETTHDMIWSLAKDGEEIPLYATLAARPGLITSDVLAWANSA